MRIQSLIRTGAAFALLVPLVATNEGLSQRDRADGNRSAGHRSKSAPKQVSAGPAMSRPAPGKDRPKADGGPPGSQGKGAGGNQRPSAGGGQGVAGKTGGFQRPNAGPGAAPKTGGDKKTPANIASRPSGPSRPGGAASSSELNDFLGGGRPGTPGKGPGDRTEIGKGDRPGIGKGDRTDIGKGDRDLGKGKGIDIGKGDRTDIGKDDRTKIGKGAGTDIGKGAQSDVNIGEVNIGSGNTTNYTQNKQAWVDNRHATGNQVRANAGNRYASAYTSGAYRRGAAGGYPYSGGWGTRGAYYGWRTTSYAAMGTFMGATWAAAAKPVFYAYGSGGNVYYENDSVYVDGQDAGTAEQYVKQAVALVAAAPAQANDAEWLPLGAFAFTREDVGDSQGMIELAINKQGVIAGTYYNQTTGVSRSLKGTLDEKSQRVAIGFADGKNADAALETGIYNLTQEEAPGLLHLGTAESMPVLLVRLQPPADNQK